MRLEINKLRQIKNYSGCFSSNLQLERGGQIEQR